MNTLQWNSKIYYISKRKIIIITSGIVLIFLFFFILEKLKINYYNINYYLINIIPLIIIFILKKLSKRNDNAFQILLYESSPAKYEFCNDSIKIYFNNKIKKIYFNKIKNFTNVSPQKIAKNLEFSKRTTIETTDYANSDIYKIYYLFIKKNSFYTSILPIFFPKEIEKTLYKNLLEKIKLGLNEKSNKEKGCYWFLFSLIIIFLALFVLISIL